jgi:peptidoglycan/LPS O-acetylase OafA/YrhL
MTARPLGHRPALDGVRAVAVSLVVLGHVDDILLPGGRDPLPGGFLGVDVFFVLSGFLITRLLLDERTGTGRVALGRFYQRRAARLLPAVALLLAGHALWVSLADVSVTRAMEVDSVLVVGLYVSNWAQQLHRDLGFGLGHLWSLSVEEQFYLVWPFLIWVTRRRPAWLWVVSGLGVGGAIFMRHQLWHDGVNWLLIYIRTDTRMDALLIGCALGLAHHRGWLDRVPAPVRRGLGAAGLAVVVGSALAFQPDRSVLYGPGFTVVAMAAAALVAGVLEPGWWLHRWLSLRPLRALGRVSYGAYLWHFPVFLAMVHAWPDGPSVAVVPASLAVTAVAVVASWSLVERPVLDWSRARQARRAPVVARVVATSAAS